MVEVLSYIEERTERLKRIAKVAANEFWKVHKSGNKVETLKSNLGCRVMVREGYFTMTWYKNSYNKTGGKYKPYSKYIKKGKQSKGYSPVVLRQAARDWEIDQVLETESAFTFVREELAVLAEVKRSLKKQLGKADMLEQFVLEKRYDVDELEEFDE